MFTIGQAGPDISRGDLLASEEMGARNGSNHGGPTLKQAIETAIYNIPEEIFLSQAGMALSQLHPIIEEMRLALELCSGNIPAIASSEEKLIRSFHSLAPTAQVIIERLLGDPIDGGAKMALASAARRIGFLQQALEKGQNLNSFEINEVRMGGDFLKLGINMMYAT